MTSMPPHDPLIALWQTASKPDPQHLLDDVKRLNRLHTRLNRTVFAILCGVAVLLIFEEATEHIGTHGILSALWILGLAAGGAWRRRAQCDRSVALTSDTITLLKSMIARAGKDLFLARCLYAGVPLGALVGYVLTSIANLGRSASAAGHPYLHLAGTLAGVGALIVMVTAGVLLARSRSRQVRELTEKLKAVEFDL